MSLKTLRNILYWGVPMLFCLIVYWPGIFVWFHEDDFAFLGLLPDIHNWHDLIYAIFQPTQHGTWRPLSERVYFTGIQWLFGTPHARPFRIVAFATQFANLALISAITLRLTRSRLAGFMAPILWIANAVLVRLMTWDATFMYALCGLVLLSAFWMLLRYIETNERRYYAGMWAIFLSGFLVLETNIVFPALAAAYTLLCSRAHFRKTLPLFIPSLVFVIADTLLIPKQSIGPYTMHLNLGMLNSLREYWVMLFEPLNVTTFTRFPQSMTVAGMALFTVLLGGFAIYQARRHRDLLPIFFLCWFAIVIAPVLPFQEHIVEYYPALPSIGIAMLVAYALARAFQGPIWSRIAVSALVIFFLLESVPSARGGAKWHNDRSYEVKNLVMGAAEVSRRNPGRVILLDGIDPSMYGAALADSPFRFLRIDNIFLAPGSPICLAQAGADIEGLNSAASEEAVLAAIDKHRLLVYRFTGNKLVNVTDPYVSQVTRLNVADRSKSGLLGRGWYPADGASRWMAKSASVKMDVPIEGCHQLHVSGYCPAAQLARGPLLMTVRVNGKALPVVRVDKADEFKFNFPLSTLASGEYEIVVELDHTVTTPPDVRELGLVFGTFSIW